MLAAAETECQTEQLVPADAVNGEAAVLTGAAAAGQRVRGRDGLHGTVLGCWARSVPC